MRINDRGDEVKDLQKRLAQVGLDPGPADGVFGPKTEKAVKEFQKKHSLVVDGIAGPVTMASLREATSVQPRKAQNRKLSDHFNEQEFACKGDGMVYVEPDLVAKLEKLRQLVGKPINITSGYRSPWYNEKIGGVKNSRHTLGQAADIVIPGLSPSEVAKLAEQAGFGGIGIYDKDRFTHVDIGPVRRWRQ